MTWLSIDPSDTRHAWAHLDGSFREPQLIAHGRDLMAEVTEFEGTVIIEQVACYGMPAGASLFDTCVQIGLILSRWPYSVRITRTEVKLLVCGQARAKDGNVRQSIIDRFGGPASTKKGGPLYKVGGDTWAAIAVGLAAMHPEARFYVPAALRRMETV